MDIEQAAPSISDTIETLLKTESGRKKLLASFVEPMKMQMKFQATPIQAFRVLGDWEQAPAGWAERVFEEVFQPETIPSIDGADQGEFFGTEPLSPRLGEYVTRILRMMVSESQSFVSRGLYQAIEERSTLAASGPLSEELLDAVKDEFFFMNARAYAPLRKEEHFWKWLSVETRLEMIRAGLFGEYKDCPVYLSRCNPVDVIYGCGKLGVLKLEVTPVRLDKDSQSIKIEMKVTVRIYWDPEASSKKIHITSESAS